MRSVNSTTGAQCIYVMLHAIFPSIATMHNAMPAGSALNSAQMVCFFLFWFITSACCFLSIPKFPILIQLKLVSFVLSSVAMLALALHVAGGGVGAVLTAPAKVTGSAHAWLIVRFLLLQVSSCATFVSNAADWQRNATKPKDPLLGQLVGFPLVGVSNLC